MSVDLLADLPTPQRPKDAFLFTDKRARELFEAIQRFLSWFERQGGLGFDPYDLWGTPYGIFSRRMYYAHRWLGTCFVLPLTAMEIVHPGIRARWIRPKRFAMADAHAIVGYLHLFKIFRTPHYLEEAERLAQHLIEQSLAGYSGACWGYPFDWQNVRGLWKKATPFATVSPYGYEALTALYDVTGKFSYLDTARSSLEFVLNDLHETTLKKGAAACSYSPYDRSLIVNASSYRAWMLMDGWSRFKDARFKTAALRNIRFVLSTQQGNGAWPYTIEKAQDAFVDNLHTCLVLKNLIRLNEILKDPQVTVALNRGYAFYRRVLIDPQGEPIPFAKAPRLQFVKRELYDYAEAIRMGLLLRHEIPEADKMARRLAETLIHRYQLPNGAFITRVYRGGWRHCFPFLRWPQAPMFSALAALLHAMQEDVCAA